MTSALILAHISSSLTLSAFSFFSMRSARILRSISSGVSARGCCSASASRSSSPAAARGSASGCCSSSILRSASASDSSAPVTREPSASTNGMGSSPTPASSDTSTVEALSSASAGSASSSSVPLAASSDAEALAASSAAEALAASSAAATLAASCRDCASTPSPPLAVALSAETTPSAGSAGCTLPVPLRYPSISSLLMSSTLFFSRAAAHAAAAAAAAAASSSSRLRFSSRVFSSRSLRARASSM
mmetsp:Transcript_28397/g.74242  ORF Transcript_28397/g.74242 Transcript_28397/m.74242 type:complete len:247 (+) Transcript_28397:143-883(+)